MDNVQCRKLGSLVVLEDGNFDKDNFKTSFVDDKQHLESVLGLARESWFEEFTISKIQLQKFEDVEERSNVMNSPSCSPSISQLINGHLTVGTSPLRHSSPAPWCKSEDSFIARLGVDTPQARNSWNRPLLGLSPCPSPIVQNILGSARSGLYGKLNLGADDSTLSWTSSLATPPRDTSITSMVSKDDGTAVKTKETARALFSPGGALDSTNESVQPLDSTVEEIQSDVENHSNVDSNLSDVEKSCGKHASGKLGVNIESGKKICQGLENVKRKGETTKETFKKRLIERKENSSEKKKKIKLESKSFSSVNMKEDKSTESVVRTAAVDDNYYDKSEDVSIASPTFSQKSKRKKFHARKTSILVREIRSPEGENPVSDILSDFFDPPSSSLRRRRPAPSFKRKSLEMEESPYYSTPKIAFHDSPVLNKSATPQGSLKSILSSDNKNKDSSNKKVRFSKSVKKCCYIPEPGSSSRSPKSVHKSRKKKPLIRNSNVDDDNDGVTFKDKKVSSRNADHVSNGLEPVKGRNEQNKDGKERQEFKTMKSEYNHSNLRIKKSSDKSFDVSKGSNVLPKELDAFDHRKNIDHSLEVLPSDREQSLDVVNESNRAGKNSDGSADTLENGSNSPKDELFSQVSQTALNEMCNVAEHSLILENDNDSNKSANVEDNTKTPVNKSAGKERKIGKLSGRKKFFYPLLSVTSVSKSSKMFQYQEDQTDSNNKKKLLQSISAKDMIVTTATVESDTSAEILKSTSDVEKSQVVPGLVDEGNRKVDEKLVKLGETKMISNEYDTRRVKRSTKMGSCSSMEEYKPALPSSYAAKPVVQNVGFHCASGQSFNISSTALDKAKALFEESVDYKTKTDSKNRSDKTKHKPDNDIKVLETSKLNSTVQSDSNLKSTTRNSKLSRLKIEKKTDEASEEMKPKLAREQVNCVPNAIAGFQSASGKTCNISSSALEKAESLLEDDKTCLQPNSKRAAPMETDGVSVVKEEIPESLSDRIKPTAIIEEEFEFSEWPDEDRDPTEGLMFTSEVLEDNITEASKEIDSENRDRTHNDNSKLTKHTSEEVLGSVDTVVENTENCKSNDDFGVVCSHSDMNKTSKSKVETNQLYQETDEVKEKQFVSYNKEFVGFQTASGTTIKFTDEKLKQAESLLEAEKDKHNIARQLNQHNIQTISECEKEFVEFQMASRKSVKITDEKLKQAESLLDSEKDNANIDVSLKQQHVKSMPEFEQMCVGFQMVSGKTVKITDEKLKLAESILTLETENEKENVNKYVNQHAVERAPECKQTFVGFQMASGKNITITEEKLKQAESILDSENENVNRSFKQNNDGLNKSFVGFQMASGKTVEIVDEKLKQAACMLENKNEEENIEMSANRHGVKSTSCLGFQMASGKAIEMTDAKLKHAETLLDVENDGLRNFDEVVSEDKVKNTIVKSDKFVNSVKDNVCSSVGDLMKMGNVCDKQRSSSSLSNRMSSELNQEFNNVMGGSGRSDGGNVMTRTANKLACLSETKDNNLKLLFEDELKQDAHSMENELDMLGELKSKILNGRGEILNKLNKSKSPSLRNSNRTNGKEGHPVDPSCLPKGFRPFKAPKMVTKSNVKENEDLKLSNKQLTSAIQEPNVEPLDSVAVNRGLKSDKLETHDTLDMRSTNLMLAENTNNKSIEIRTNSLFEPEGISDNKQVPSNNVENPIEVQKSLLDDKNDNDLFQGLSQYFEEEMDFEENDDNVQCGETDGTGACMSDVSAVDDTIEKDCNLMHAVHLTEGASPEPATISHNSEGECKKNVSDTCSTVNHGLEVQSPDTTLSAQNQEEEIECAHILDRLNSPHSSSVTRHQKSSYNGNIKVLETTMNDSGFGTGSSNLSKLTDGSLNQSEDTFNVTIDHIKVNNSATDVVSKFGNNDYGTLSKPDQNLAVSLCGFKTASGIEINMSDSALQKARKTLVDAADNIDDDKIIEVLNQESELDKVEADNGTSSSQKDAISHRNLTENMVLEDDAEKLSDDSVLASSISQVLNVCTTLGIQAEMHEGVGVVESNIPDDVQQVSCAKVYPMKKSSCYEKTATDMLARKELDSVSSTTDSEKRFTVGDNAVDNVSDATNSEIKFMNIDNALDNVKLSHDQRESEIDTSPETSAENHTAVKFNVEQSVNYMLEKAKVESEFNNETQAIQKVAVGPDTGTHFVGFTTASGKNVTVCAEALEHARAGFDYDANNGEIKSGFEVPTSSRMVEPSEQNCMKKTQFGGFSTASGRKVVFSEQALKHARDSLDSTGIVNETGRQILTGLKTPSERTAECSGQAQEHTKTALNDAVKEADNKHRLKGFSTASGKNVACSKDALKHAKFTLDGATKELDTEQTFKGFSTASGKKVACSEDALKHARVTLDGATKEFDTEQTFKGFSTASGKKVAFSEDALKHAKNTLDGATKEFASEQTSKGFSTASGKKVACSEQALKHARDLLDNAVDKAENGHSPMGFSTASEKKVALSEQALRHSKNSLENVMDKTENGHNFIGLSTASGKTVEFSEQALKHAKDSIESVADKAENGQSVMGFSTASGKKVAFSKQALKHAKDTLDSVVGESKSDKHLIGFSTASGQKVAFSEQALKHAKLTLDSALDIPEHEHPQESVTFMGFNTASGQTVECSERALEHVKLTLKDDSRHQLIVPSCPMTLRDENRFAKGAEKGPAMLGFSTAGGKTVDVSDKALNIIKTSVLPGHSAGVDMEDEGGVDDHTHEDNSEDMEEIFANALKRQKLDVNKERRLLHVSSEEIHTLKRKVAKPASPEKSADKRHPGFRPFKPVFCKTSLETKNNCSSKTLNPAGTSTTPNVAFKTPFKTTIMGNLNKHPVTMIPVSDEKMTSSDIGSNVTPTPGTGDASEFSKVDTSRLAKSDTPYHAEGAPSELAKGDASRLAKGNAMECSKGDASGFVHDSGPAQSDSSLPGSRGDNIDSDTTVANSVDGTIGQVKILTDTSVDITVTKSASKELEGNISSEKVVTVYKTTTTGVNGQEQKDCSDNVDNVNSNGTIINKSPKSANFRNGNIETCEQNWKSCDSSVTETPGQNLISTPSTGGVVTDNSSANNVQNDSYDFDSFSQDEEDVYYCMLVEARAAQDAAIKQRSASRVQAVAGKLWNMKQTKGRWKLQDFIEKKALSQICSVYNEVTSRTATDYKFKMEQYFGRNKANITIGDGAYLVPDDSGNIGKYEIYRAFLTIEGVDSKLITDTWLYNHYRWIVWKLAAYERFSSSPKSSCLTPTVVLLQLKYRYDREVDRAQRCSIKKIYERDDTPSKRMVLCVANVRRVNIDDSSGDNKGHRTMLELSDGWYSIPTQIDHPLTELVDTGRIFVGQKLCISGAELVGGDDACTPLEAPASIMLKIGRNSTRPATWDCKLGYQGDPRPLCVPLSGLCSEGGIVGTVDVVIVRKYPTMYMEKLEGGGCTFRTGKCEERACQEFDTRKQTEMEKVYRLVESSAEKEDIKDKKVVRRKRFTRTTVEGFQTGREIYDAIEEAARPDTVQNYLSDHQMSMLYEYQRQVMEEKQSEMNSKFRNAWEEKSETFKERVVTPVLKFRVSGCSNMDLDSNTSTILTVWRPSAEISDVQEGHRYKIYSLNTSMARSKYIGHTVQLTATKQTRYRRMQLDENILDNIYEAREVLLVSDVKRYQPMYGELDFVGVIVKIALSSQSNRAGDMVYLADYQAGILAVRFTNGFKSFGEDIFVVGNTMCCCNLMDKFPYRNRSIPTVDASTEFTQLSNKPLNANQRKSLDKLNSSCKDKMIFITAALNVISDLMVDKEPVPVYEKIKNLNEEFKVQFPNRSKPDESKNNNNMRSDTSSGVVSGHEEAGVPTDHCEATTVSSVCGSILNCNTSPSNGCTEVACDKIDTENSMEKSENIGSVMAEVETKTGEGSSSGPLIKMAATPEVNQADVTPVTQRRRSIAKTKMSRLLSYGSPAVLSPLSLSVPRSVNRGFKPPAFKKL